MEKSSSTRSAFWPGARALATAGADIAVGSSLEAMYEHFELCLSHGVNVVTIEEESFYPWRTAPALAAKLDAVAMRSTRTSGWWAATLRSSGSSTIAFRPR